MRKPTFVCCEEGEQNNASKAKNGNFRVHQTKYKFI